MCRQNVLRSLLKAHDPANELVLLFAVGHHAQDELEHLRELLEGLVLADVDDVDVAVFDAFLVGLQEVVLDLADDGLPVLDSGGQVEL